MYSLATSTFVSSTLCKTKKNKNHTFIANLLILFSSFDSSLFFGRGSFFSNESANFEKNVEKVFEISLELKETLF